MTRITATLREDQYPSLTISCSFRHRMLQTHVVEGIKAHISCSITFFFFNGVYEIAWKNIAATGRAQITIWRMRLACCIPTAIDTHSRCVMINASLLPQILHERA